jgi:hypothetical protein
MRQIDPSLRLEVEGCVDFLIAGRNLRRDGATLSFYHPRVEDGPRVAMEEQPGTVPALAAVFRSRGSKHNAADLRMLIQAAEVWQRGEAWEVAAEYWDSGLEDLYAVDIKRADLTDAAAR